jgi:hypothetical protein
MNFKKITFLLMAGTFLFAGRNANAQTATFNPTNTGDSGLIQTFTVPCGVHSITVEALGAQGGLTGGKGAQIQGTFTCVPGEVLNILVGQAGGSKDASHGSGGGGSFVVRQSDDTILVIAGGGGGHGASGIDATSNGSATRNGQTGAGSGTASSGGGGGAAANGASGGVGCNIGSGSVSSVWAGGGGGFCGDGGMYDNNTLPGGYSFLHGGWGGPGNSFGANCPGGYGGGSGAGDRGAGGGGYSGGSGGTSNSLGGGGGGSYNAGTAQINNAGVQSGPGQVIITWSIVATAPTILTNVITNVSCNGGSNGSASVVATGGTGTYTYAWAPSGGTKDTVSNLTAGVYTVTVNDSCGNSATATATITQPAALSIARGTVAAWLNSCNGKAYVTVSGGTAPYTYMWSPGGATTDTIKNLCHTSSYCCTVTDNNGCVDSACMNIATGIPVINDASSINIFPNPNNGMFTVSGLSKGMEVEVYNYMGEKISDMKATDINMQFNIADKSAGAYLVRILSQDGKLVGQEKLIKQD